MARVVAFIPDLLFGSNVVGALQAGGHEPVLVPDVDSLSRELTAAQALIVDLTADARVRLEQLESVLQEGLPALAFYSHVEVGRACAGRAGRLRPRRPPLADGARGRGLVDRLLEAGEND